MAGAQLRRRGIEGEGLPCLFLKIQIVLILEIVSIFGLDFPFKMQF